MFKLAKHERYVEERGVIMTIASLKKIKPQSMQQKVVGQNLPT